MNEFLFKKILFDYFDGTNTSIQGKLIEEWIKDPQNKELFFQYLDEWEQQHPQYIFDIESGLKKVYQTIENPPLDIPQSIEEVKTINFSPYLKWLSAASILLFFTWIGWVQLNKPTKISYNNLVKATKEHTGEIYEKENLTSKPILINLPDKSSVILQPKSKICYSPKQYNRTKREVILSGDAFFEVQKNAKRPFFVYTNELITKVLGTSFTIRSKSAGSEIEVIVKTGRVAIFLQNDRNKKKKIENTMLDGLVLNANEKVKIDRNENKIDRPTPVKQDQLNLPIQRYTFNFDDAPVVEVLKELEQAYTVQVIYNQDKLATCKLTAHLSDEPLLEKLELICSALEAKYEIIDNRIILTASGCK